jgi:hypothetical protein
MKIKNINGLSADDLEMKVADGGRFVYFAFTISLVVITLKRTSGVYLLQPGENAAAKSIPFTLLSLLFGWWGIPYGPKYTIQSISTNLTGGKDVTDEVMSTVAGHKLFRETQLKQVPQL